MDTRTLTAAQVYDEGPVQVLVVDESRVLAGAAGMLQREVALLVASEDVATLLIHQQFLEHKEQYLKLTTLKKLPTCCDTTYKPLLLGSLGSDSFPLPIF